MLYQCYSFFFYSKKLNTLFEYCFCHLTIKMGHDRNQLFRKLRYDYEIVLAIMLYQMLNIFSLHTNKLLHSSHALICINPDMAIPSNPYKNILV